MFLEINSLFLWQKDMRFFCLFVCFCFFSTDFALLLNKIPYSAKDNDISRGEETIESLSFIFPTILILSYALNNWSNESQGQEDMKYIVRHDNACNNGWQQILKHRCCCKRLKIISSMGKQKYNLFIPLGYCNTFAFS